MNLKSLFDYKVSLASHHVVFALKGGMGNQLFQLAAALNYCILNHRCFSLDLVKGRWDFSLEFLNISPNKCYQPTLENGKLTISSGKCEIHKIRIRPEAVYKEPHFHFSEIPNLGFVYFDGYWQSPKHFRMIQCSFKEMVREKLALSVFPDQGSLNMHVRLGDMAFDKQSREFHGIQPESYFINSINRFKIDYNKVCIVSESINDVSHFYPNLYANISKFKCGSALEDFVFLSQSHRLVISHSTFSWWAGFLSSGEVIAPRNWFSDRTLQTTSIKDLFPKHWTVI